jgi:hypothetical protein
MSVENIFTQVFSNIRDKIPMFKFKDLRKNCEVIYGLASQGKIRSLYIIFCVLVMFY